MGEGGCGYDKDAAKFIHEFTTEYEGDSVAPPPIFLASPESKLLAEMDNFVHQDEFFAGLVKVLRENKEFDALTEEEKKVIDYGNTKGCAGDAHLNAGRIYEELGRYDLAIKSYELSAPTGDMRACIALARVARYQKDWKAAEQHLAVAETYRRYLVEEFKGAGALDLQSEIAAERSYRLLAEKKNDELRQTLVAAIKANPSHDRVPEMHYYAGLASYKLKRKEWANFHWGWVMANAAEDRHYMRAYSAATNEASPFPNPDLDEGAWKSGEITQDSADAARAKVIKEYERLKDTFNKDDYWTVKPDSKRETEPEKKDDEEKEDGFSR